jgi:hypothetical protein
LKSRCCECKQAGERNASAPPVDDLSAVEAAHRRRHGALPGRLHAARCGRTARFPHEGALWLEVELIKRLSPDSHSVMEFKSELDVHIAEKMLKFPTTGSMKARPERLCWRPGCARSSANLSLRP